MIVRLALLTPYPLISTNTRLGDSCLASVATGSSVTAQEDIGQLTLTATVIGFRRIIHSPCPSQCCLITADPTQESASFRLETARLVGVVLRATRSAKTNFGLIGRRALVVGCLPRRWQRGKARAQDVTVTLELPTVRRRCS